MTWPGSYPHTYLFSKGVVHWIQITIDLCILGGQVAKYCYLPSYSFSSCFLMRFSWNNLHLNIPKQFQVKPQRLIIFNLVLACLSIKFGRNTMVIKSYLLIMFNPFIHFFLNDTSPSKLMFINLDQGLHMITLKPSEFYKPLMLMMNSASLRLLRLLQATLANHRRNLRTASRGLQPKMGISPAQNGDFTSTKWGLKLENWWFDQQNIPQQDRDFFSKVRAFSNIGPCGGASGVQVAPSHLVVNHNFPYSNGNEWGFTLYI